MLRIKNWKLIEEASVYFTHSIHTTFGYIVQLSTREAKNHRPMHIFLQKPISLKQFWETLLEKCKNFRCKV